MGVGHLPHAWEYWDVEEERREKGEGQKIEGDRGECHGRTGSHPHYTVLSQERQRPPRSSMEKLEIKDMFRAGQHGWGTCPGLTGRAQVSPGLCGPR